jgi:large subunit ribosomal protein L10
VVLTEYKGLTVAEIANLRRILKGVGAEYKVVKNTLISIAAKGTPVEAAGNFLVGPTGLAFGFDDAVAMTKKVLEFSDKNEKFKVKSGIIDGRLCTVDEIKTIAKLPPRGVLLSMLAGAFQAPLTKLGSALNATVVQFVYGLEALKVKKAA